MQLGVVKGYFSGGLTFGIFPLHLAMAASRLSRDRSGCCADFFPPLEPICRKKSLIVAEDVISQSTWDN
jgi:hypothetical protein